MVHNIAYCPYCEAEVKAVEHSLKCRQMAGWEHCRPSEAYEFWSSSSQAWLPIGMAMPIEGRPGEAISRDYRRPVRRRSPAIPAWVFVHSPPGGHRWFRCRQTGRLSCCDESGALPSNSDDGPLWLDTARPIVLAEDESGRISCRTPVLQHNTGNRPVHVISNLKEVGWLVMEQGMTVVIPKLAVLKFKQTDTDWEDSNG